MIERLRHLFAEGLSTRVYLVAFVAVLIAPGLAFTGVLLDHYGRAERARVEQEARENARQVAAAVDHDALALAAILETLATSPHPRADRPDDDLAAFDAQARAVRTLAGVDIVLHRVDGRPLVDTRLPPGAALPRVETARDLDRLRTRRVVVSDVFAEPSAPGATYVVSVPLMREGAVDLILSSVVPADRLGEIVRRELGRGWAAGVVDGRNAVVASSRDAAADRSVAPDFDPAAAIAAGRAAGALAGGAISGDGAGAGAGAGADAGSGTWRGRDRAGRDVLFAAAPVPRAGWTVAAGTPEAPLEAGLRTWMTLFVGLGLAVLALTSLIATRLWAVVERPIRALAASETALARGEVPPTPSTPIREIRHLARALGTASVALRAREAERDGALAEQARGLAALRESEARFRHVADSAPALIWMTDEQGRITFVNLRFDHVFGLPGARMLGDGWREIVLEEDRDPFQAAFFAAFEARRPFRAEVRARDRDGGVRWLRSEGVPRLDDARTFLGYTGCSLDVTDVRLAQDQQQLLINELNHRVKNTLATVQSIARQSLRNLRSREAEAARGAFEARLLALARAHNVLTQSHWEGAALAGIVADAVAPVEPPGGRRRRFAIGGPDLWLPAPTALSIAMALHELLTNAVKYGALSAPAGRVAIRWTVAEGHPGDPDHPSGGDPSGGDAPSAAPRGGWRLHLEWREEGGPPVAPPDRRGFGSRLVERGLARELDGRVELFFAPEGVVCTIEAPLALASPRSGSSDASGRPANRPPSNRPQRRAAAE